MIVFSPQWMAKLDSKNQRGGDTLLECVGLALCIKLKT